MKSKLIEECKDNYLDCTHNQEPPFASKLIKALKEGKFIEFKDLEGDPIDIFLYYNLLRDNESQEM